MVLVNPGKTSQRCSRCGMIAKKTLSDRTHSCPHCELVLDRDQCYEIGTATSGTNYPGCPPTEMGGAVTGTGDPRAVDARGALHPG
ncbi:MAG: zinc ribbon domain-containing protein [Candidatus Methanoculleus thermohydrogenotrophicum]